MHPQGDGYREEEVGQRHTINPQFISAVIHPDQACKSVGQAEPSCRDSLMAFGSSCLMAGLGGQVRSNRHAALPVAQHGRPNNILLQ